MYELLETCLGKGKSVVSGQARNSVKDTFAVSYKLLGRTRIVVCDRYGHVRYNRLRRVCYGAADVNGVSILCATSPGRAQQKTKCENNVN